MKDFNKTIKKMLDTGHQIRIVPDEVFIMVAMLRNDGTRELAAYFNTKYEFIVGFECNEDGSAPQEVLDGLRMYADEVLSKRVMERG